MINSAAPRPAWAVETCDADSTDNTLVTDFYGPNVHPVPSLGMHLVQRVSTRHGITLHDPAHVVLIPDRQVTPLDAAGLRALAREALDLATCLDQA